MKKLMIIGASILQLPGVIKAKEMGYQVAVVDYDPNAVAIPYADVFYNVSTIDVDGVCRVANEFKPDGIITLASDMPMRSVASASKKLGLKAISPETAIKATDKNEMIKAFKEHNVPSPWYYTIKTYDELELIIDKITYPCIIKPVDNSGSRGIYLCHSKEEINEKFEYSLGNSRGAGVIIEEYLIGNEISVETITFDGTVHILAITDKLTTGAPHFVEMGHSQPANFDDDIISKIKDVAIKAIEAVGIDIGPAHVEMMVTENGPKMIELGARMGGDCISTHLVPLSTGIDMMAATIKCACGEKPDVTPKFKKGSVIRYFKTAPGVIKKIDGVDEAYQIDGVKEISFTKKVGDKAGNINSSSDRVGFVISQSDTAENAVRICEKALGVVKFLIE